MSLELGTTLGPYEVVTKIGEGGMGEVYRARDTKLDRDVALKVLPPAFGNDPDRRMSSVACLPIRNMRSAVDRQRPNNTPEGTDAPICQDSRSRSQVCGLARSVVCHHALKDLAGEKAFETADDLPFGPPFSGASFDVVEGW